MSRKKADINVIADGVKRGDKRMLARAITLVENGHPHSRELIKMLTGPSDAYIIGLTGPPGVGKSTLVHQLALSYRKQNKSVAVLAVDPTSPFTGGAILGDRIRMLDGEGIQDVFIRSMASRGHAGGLSRATADALRLMAAAGHDVIILETVGAGQGEVEVMRFADTTLVVLVPNLGDDIQAIKAGILEIGDLFIVNKKDLGGADAVIRQLQMMLDLGDKTSWRPIIHAIAARDGHGIDEVLGSIEQHRHVAMVDERNHKLIAAENELRSVLADRLVSTLLATDNAQQIWSDAIRNLAERKSDPYTEIERVLAEVE